ncbi:hypothetical protein [Amycolatopsis sp. NPDC004079]|uniref:hypothetical protein n=1 Tax=Amycolatopsis sp. NPDC004079 TaxID=3154549 RepID=UPI0033A5E6D6
MNPDLWALVAQHQDALRAEADQRRLGTRKPTPAPKDSARQRLGWWLMSLGLRLAAPKRREGLLEGM